MSTLHVSVEKQHIAEGTCFIAQRCMIAQAIKQWDPNVHYVSVRAYGMTVTWRFKNGSSIRRRYALPRKAALAIVRFDMGQTIQPFAFDAKMIDEKIIKPVDRERARKDAARTYARRQAMLASGIPLPNYGRQARVGGV